VDARCSPLSHMPSFHEKLITKKTLLTPRIGGSAIE
jgi:hypothetical protein